MGAWGTEPKDNDESADLFYEIETTWDACGLEIATRNLHGQLKTTETNYSDGTQRKFELLGMTQLFFDKLEEGYEGSLTYDNLWKDELIPDILWTCHQYAQDCLNDTPWQKQWMETQKLVDNLHLFKKNTLELVKKTL